MARVVWLGLAGLLGLFPAACTEVNGGAVEASWTIRTPDGRGSSCGCSDPLVSFIRFEVLEIREDGLYNNVCTGKSACTMHCDASGHTGATPFDILPGLYDISLIPEDTMGTDLRIGTSARPPVHIPANPQRRHIVNGQVTQLDNLLVEVNCAERCGGNDSQRICAP